MNCDDLIPLMDAYLDSELDPKTTWDIQQHLAGCPHCAARFAHAEHLNRQLDDALKRADATPELWAAVERQLTIGTAPGSAREEPRTAARPGVATAAEPWWRFWLWPAPQAYAALAAIWMLLFAIESTSRQDAAPTAGYPAPARAEAGTQTRVALAQQRQLRAELLDVPRVETAAERPIPPQSRTSYRGGRNPV